MRKGIVTALVFFALILAPALPAFAQDIYLSHTLNGFTEGTDTATLDITLHVENLGATDLSNLVLSYVPFIVIAVDEVTVNVASIMAEQNLDIPITIVTSLPFDEGFVEQEPLFWAGEYENNDGSENPVEFPAISNHTGGAL